MDRAKRHRAFRPDGSEAGPPKDAAVNQVLTVSEFHHEDRLAIDGGELNQSFAELWNMARDGAIRECAT